ncbi:hypothetical protein QCE63_21815 [Caballeronia sp. LZ065]|uniref:hypothetical protein n=1 Tax=Caballeronia sp. LZ065 TaxID=3038571 RepID=UPI0028579B8F|nr:hypothetical protein [Caballeronia sp. LZ065]MDR5782040.1 hypothetical protein [Caballeronia sp. LZ065]
MDLYFEECGLRNRTASSFSRRAHRSEWSIEHAEPDETEAPDHVSRGGQAGLQQMFEKVLVQAVLQVAGGAFHHVFAAKTAFNDLEAIWSSAAPWDQQLLQLADILPRYSQWLPGPMQPRLTAIADNLKDAISIWQSAKEIGEILRGVDERGGSWMDKLDSSLRALTGFESRLPARIQPMLASLKGIIRHADAVHELYARLRAEDEVSNEDHDEHGRGWVERLARRLPSELSRMLLEDADSPALLREAARAYEAFEAARRGASVKEVMEALKDWAGAEPGETMDFLDTIRLHIGAYLQAYETMSAIMSRPRTLDVRLRECAAFIAYECPPQLKDLLLARASPAIDLCVGLTRSYAAAQGFYESAMTIAAADTPVHEKLTGLIQVIDRFASADLQPLPQSAQNLIARVSQVLHVTAAGFALGQAASAQETISHLRAVVEQLGASLPHLLDVLPEGSGDSAETVVRVLDLLVRQFEALSRLPERPGFEDVMQAFLQDQGSLPWLPEFMQPLLQVARQLSRLLPSWRSYPESGSLADQLSWTLETLQSEQLTDETIGLLPARVAGIVRPGRVVFLRMKGFPVLASPVEQAQWLMRQLSEAELGELLAAGGLPVAEWRRAFISDEHVGVWFDALLDLTRCKSWTAAANTVFNLATLSHVRAASLSTVEAALAYVPFGAQAKQILHWVKGTQIATTWQQTARNFFSAVKKDVMHDPAAAFRLLPGAMSADLARTMKLVKRLSIYADRWDWAGVLCDLREFSESKALCDALLAMRIAWSFQALARADVHERIERLGQLEADVRKLHMLGWTGMNTLVHLLPLLPALWELRGQVRIDVSGARNWFDWAAAMMRALAASNAPAAQQLRTRIEEQTQAWVAGALQGAITSVLGEACATTLGGRPGGAMLTPLEPRFARDLSLAGVEEDSEGIFRVDGRCYVQSDGRAFLVKWNLDERAFCLIANERAGEGHGRRPLVRTMNRWWTRRRAQGGLGGGPILFEPSAETGIGAPQPAADTGDILEARGIEYWNDDNQVRLRDFVIASDEQESSASWKPIVAGVAGGLGLLGVIGYFCYMAAGRARTARSGNQDKDANEPLLEPAVPLQDLAELRPSESSEELSELLDKPVATHAIQSADVNGPSGAQLSTWRPTNTELILGVLIGGVSLAAAGWASRQAWIGYNRSTGVVDDAVLSVARQAPARQFDIVIDVPFDASALHSGHHVSKRQAAPFRAAAQNDSIEHWALPRYSEASDYLTAMVLERFDQSASYKPNEGDFATKVADGIYWNAQRSRSYICIAGRYWRIHVLTAEDSRRVGWDRRIAKIFSLNDADKSIFVKKEDEKWRPFADPIKPLPSNAAAAICLDPSVSRAVKRWSFEEVFHYPDEVPGVEGRLYTHWGGAHYIVIDGKYRSATLFHPNLLCVMGSASGASAERLYLKRHPFGSIWTVAAVVRPLPLPRKFSDDLIGRANALLNGKPSVPDLKKDETSDVYRSVNEPNQGYVLLDGLYYKCKSISGGMFTYPAGSCHEVWEIYNVNPVPFRDSIYAGVDAERNWRSLIQNNKNELWLEDIDYASIALQDRVTASVQPAFINYPAAVTALLPGKFESFDETPFLRVNGKLYRCETVTIPADEFADTVLTETVKFGNYYAAYARASWVLLQKDAQGKWGVEESGTTTSAATDDLSFSVSAGVYGIAKSFDPAYALADGDTGVGKDGNVYRRDDQLYLSIDGKYWPFFLLAPHMGIVFGNATRTRMVNLVNAGGVWTADSVAPPLAALSQLFETRSFDGLQASLGMLLQKRGFSIWSQLLDALDYAADHYIYSSYLEPGSENFKRALKLKFQTAFLKSITDQSSAGLNLSEPKARVDPDRVWDVRKISQILTFVAQEREAFDDVDFREAYIVHGSSAQIQAEFEKAKKEHEAVDVQLKNARRKKLDLLLYGEARGNKTKQDLKLDYWEREITRLRPWRGALSLTILDLEQWLSCFEDNVFAAGVAMGVARETAGLKALKGTGGSSSHWLYELMYSGLVADLTWEIIAQASASPEAPQLAALEGARLYIETQWAIHHKFSQFTAKLAALPENKYWFNAKGDYRDILSAQNAGKALATDLFPIKDGVEQVGSAQVLSALVYHLVTSNKRASSVGAGEMDGLFQQFDQAKRDLNPLQAFGAPPENFFSMSQFKPSSLTDSDKEYYDQFADYVDRGFMNYEASWITSQKLIEGKLTVDELFDVKRVYLIKNPLERRREAYIKLSSSEWLVVILHKPVGSSGKVDICEKMPEAALRTKPFNWFLIPTNVVSDGHSWSALRRGRTIGRPRYEFFVHAKIGQLKAGETVFSALFPLVRDALSDTVEARKKELYTNSFAKSLLSFLPFYGELYMYFVDRNYKPSLWEIGMDVGMTVLLLLPGFNELYKAGTSAIREIFAQGVRNGLSGADLLRYAAFEAGDAAADGALYTAKAVAMMIFDLHCPVSWRMFHPEPGFKARNYGRAMVSKDRDLFFGARAYMPSDTINMVFRKLDDEFKLVEGQLPEGKLVEVHAVYRGSQMEPLASASTSASASSTPKLWKIVGNDRLKNLYLLEQDGNRYLLTFDGARNQYRLVNPANPTEASDYVFHTDRGWRQSPPKGLWGFPYETKPILQFDARLTHDRGNEMRALIRASRDEGRRLLTGGLETLLTPGPEVDKVLDIFMGGHSPEMKKELVTKINASVVALEQLRPSKDVSYDLINAEERTAIMATVTGPNRVPPRDIVMTSGSSVRLKPANHVGGESVVLMAAYSDGMKVFEDHLADNFSAGMALTMVHESFHVHSKSPLDWYAGLTQGGMHINNLISYAGRHLKEAGADGQLKNLSIDTLVSDSRYDSRVKFTLAYARNPPNIKDSVYRFKTPQDVERAFADKPLVRTILNDTLTNLSPKMASNPDSFAFAIYALKSLRSDPERMQEFFRRYDSLFNTDTAVFEPLSWPFVQPGG